MELEPILNPPTTCARGPSTQVTVYSEAILVEVPEVKHFFRNNSYKTVSSLSPRSECRIRQSYIIKNTYTTIIDETAARHHSSTSEQMMPADVSCHQVSSYSSLGTASHRSIYYLQYDLLPQHTRRSAKECKRT
jgi:hypothetical protein